MEKCSEPGHTERRRRNVTWCLAIDAAPDYLRKLHLEGQLSYRKAQAGPRYPLCLGKLLKFILSSSLRPRAWTNQLSSSPGRFLQMCKAFWGVYPKHRKKTCGCSVRCLYHLFFFVEVLVNMSQVQLCSVLTENKLGYFCHQTLVYGKWYIVFSIPAMQTASMINKYLLYSGTACKVWLIDAYRTK